MKNVKMKDDYKEMACGELYKAAKHIYEKDKDLKKAAYLLKLLVQKYPDTTEAAYARGFIEKIEGDKKNDLSELKELNLRFHGSAKEYFRLWVVNLCMSLLTLGIFSAWAKVRKKRYIYSNVSLAGTPFQYLAQPLPILKGRIIAAILFFIYYASSHFFVATYPYVLVLGLILAPWVLVRSAAFNARYSAYRNMTFEFKGTYKDSLKVIYFWGLIPLFILGTSLNIWGQNTFAKIILVFVVLIFSIAFPWWMRGINNYIFTRTTFGNRPGQFGATGGEFFKVYFTSGLIITAVGIITSLIMIPLVFVLKDTQYMRYLVVLGIIPVYAGYIFGFAYLQAHITNTVWNKVRLGPLKFKSSLRGRDMAKLYFTNLISIILSAGMLIPWAVIRVTRYRVKKTQVFLDGSMSEFQGGEKATVQATGAELGEFFDVDLSI